MNEDFGWSGDEFLMGDCMDDWAELDDCPLDGDAESALASVGWGTDEDYGFYGDDPYEYDGGD